MENINYEVQGHIGIVKLNRAPVNSLTQKMYQEICDIFEEMAADSNIWVAILTTGQKHFSAGNNMEDFATFGEDAMVTLGKALASPLLFPKPLISAVQGAVVGAGLTICAGADFLIASEDAFFILGEVNVGLVGDIEICTNMFPPPALKYLAITGDRLTARQMEHYGVALRVVEKEALLEEALKLARLIESKPPLAAEASKRIFQKINEVSRIANGRKALIDVENVGYLDLTEDFKEATSAFLEKRKPVFQRK